MARASLLCALAIFMAVAAMRGEATVTCGSVQGSLAPCLKYLTTANAVPDARCCGGVKSLLKAAGTPGDRRTACSCLKSAAGSIPTIIPQNAIKLPSSCGVNIPYQISPKTNCNK